MGVSPKRPKRGVSANDIDLGSINANKYNDAVGADKVIIIEPVVVQPVLIAENIGAGRYVKITGTTYTLDLLGKAYDPTKVWQKGDIVSNTTEIYMATQDAITGVFDVAKWRRVAFKTIGPITVSAGAIVSTGRWHNSVSVAGFLIDDDTFISLQRVRD